MTGTPVRALRVVTLYADVMNVYADRGNLIALQARAAEHGMEVEVVSVSLGESLPEDADLVLIGGGQDREQRRVADELAAHGSRLRAWAETGTAMLAVCGGFQLFGRWYRDASGKELPGAGVFDVTTLAPGPGAARCIGDILVTAEIDGVREVVGFENHGGRTYLGPAGRPFARVAYGHGNNGEDGTEGAIFRNAIGTYLHGSLLPKNPALLDWLIGAALQHRYGEGRPEAQIESRPAPYAERAHAASAAVTRRRSPRFEAVVK